MVKNLNIKPENNSPAVHIDAEKGVFNLSGSSFLEDSVSFYSPIMNWIEEFCQNPKDLTLNIELSYFNSSAAKIILTALKELKSIQKKGFKLTINWMYTDDDEDIRDSGHDFAKLAGLEFNMIEKTA